MNFRKDGIIAFMVENVDSTIKNIKNIRKKLNGRNPKIESILLIISFSDVHCIEK